MKRFVLSNDTPIQKQAWQVREPKYLSDPTEHEQFARHKIGNIGILTAASIRGKNHEHQGKWREDAFCVHVGKDSILMSAADGAGSCLMSRVGAGIACQTAVEFLRESLYEKNDLRASLKNAVIHSVSAIEQEAAKRNIPKAHLSTTLMLAVYVKIGKIHRIAALQIGDGVMCSRLSSGEIRVIGESDHGEYGGQSLFLTNDIGDMDRKIIVSESESLKSFAMLTDGISDDFFPSDKGLKRFFDETDAALYSIDAIKTWIRYEKTGSYDDRTMILLSLPSDKSPG